MSNTKMIGGGLILLVALAGVSYMVFGRDGGDKAPEVAVVENVAKVNGVDIAKSTYDSQLALAITNYKSQGVNTEDPVKLSEIKTQVLNDLVNNELVAQGIKSSGVTVTPAEIEAQYQLLLTQVGGADKLKEQLDAAKMTDEQLRLNIANQLAVQAYLLKNIDSSSIKVTDTDISNFYKEYSKDKKDVPALKDLKEQIRQQLTANQQQVLVNAFLASLREKATVETSSNL